MSSPTSHEQYQQQYGSYYSSNSEYPAFYVNYPSSYSSYNSSHSYTPIAAYEFYGNNSTGVNKISTVPSTSCSPQSSSSSFNFGTNINNFLTINKRDKIRFLLE